MKKQQKQFWILLVLVVIIGIGYLIFHYMNVKKDAKEAKEEEADKVYVCQIDADDITGFSYDYSGAQITFTKQDGTYVDPDDTETVYLQDYFTTMESAVENLEATQVIEEPSDTSQYGFDTPTQTITVSTTDKTVTLIIGDYNDTIQSYYVMNQDSKDVYVVDETLFNAFDHAKADMLDTSDDSSDSD